MRVIIAGSSGLIGSELLRLLLENENITSVLALVRKVQPIQHPKLEQLKLNFDSLYEYRNNIHGDAIYCCLGTTQKKTPDRIEYRKIDHDYPVILAEIAAENKIEQYHFISALGANKKSSAFYNRLKGETEEDISRLSIPSIHIYQPSLLSGNRPEKRVLERISIAAMKFINPLLTGSLKKYRSIEATAVATAIIKQTFNSQGGIYFYPSNKIQELA